MSEREREEERRRESMRDESIKARVNQRTTQCGLGDEKCRLAE